MISEKEIEQVPSLGFRSCAALTTYIPLTCQQHVQRLGHPACSARYHWGRIRSRARPLLVFDDPVGTRYVVRILDMMQMVGVETHKQGLQALAFGARRPGARLQHGRIHQVLALQLS